MKDLRISIDYKDKQGMLRKVAHHMQSSAKGLAGNIIDATDLENILTDYLRGIIEKGEPRMVARQMIYQLRHRNFILCYLGAGSYAFVHRTFLEYFCAWEFVWQFEKEKTLTVEQLKNEVFAPHWQDESWHEVLRLISGMIDAKFVAEMIDYLLEQQLTKDNLLHRQRRKNRQGKEGIINILLAASCFVEVSNKKTIEVTASNLINALHDEIKEESPYLLTSKMATLLVSLVTTIGQNNPEKTLQLLKNCLEFKLSQESKSYVPASIVKAVSQGWHNPITLDWLKKYSEQYNSAAVRGAAVESLAQGWQEDLDTLLPILENRLKDNDWNVRRIALEALTQCRRHDSNTLFVLKNAIYDDNGVVRCIALETLVRDWKNDTDLDILSLLKYSVENNTKPEVRRVAVRLLSQGWKDSQEILPLLESFAKDYNNRTAQYAAIEILSKDWKDRFGMFELLHKIAVSHDFNRNFNRDKNSEQSPREVALKAIVKNYSDRPEVLDLLLDRSNNDPDEQVREFAEEQLTIWRSRSIY